MLNLLRFHCRLFFFLSFMTGMSIARDKLPWDRLEIYGNKEIQLSDYHVRGDFNQFLQKNPGVITESKFDQRTRIQVRGEVGDGVEVQAVFDDSNFKEDDEKILINLQGDTFEMALGRISLDMSGTRFILNNRKALGIFVKRKFNKLESSLLISRSEGQEERETLKGQGLTREYLLKKSPLVPGSEKITLDGRKLQEGKDYRVDYEGGSFQLDQELLPVENTSTIIVEYESSREGAAFKNRIFATRQQYTAQKGQKFGFSYVLEKDEISKEFASLLQSTPHELSVIGVDAQLKLAQNLNLKMETAHSEDKQDILSHSRPILVGNALDLSLDFKNRGHQLQVRKERIEPEFRSVGKKAFLSQGEDGGLVGDISENSLQYLWSRKDFNFRQTYRSSETNLSSDPTKESKEFQGLSSEVNGVFASRIELSAGVSHENHPTFFEGELRSEDILRKKFFKLEYPAIKGLRLALQSQNETKGTAGRREEFLQDRSLNFFATKNKNWNWNYGIKVRDTKDNMTAEEISSSRDHKLSLNFKRGRGIQSQANFVIRDDDEIREGTKARSVSSQFDLRYRPTKKFDYSLKWKQEEKKRMILETSRIDLSQDVQAQSKKTYLTPTNPIQNLISSQSLRYQQNANVFHRLNHRFRSEWEQISDKTLVENESLHYDLKWNLPWDIRLRYQWRWNDRFNANSKLDRSSYSHDYELVKNYRSSTTLTATLKDEEETDHWLNTKQEILDGSLRWERSLSRLFRTHGTVIGRDKAGGENSREWSLGGGVVYTPGLNDLRVGLEVSKGRLEQKNSTRVGDVEEMLLSLNKNLFDGAFLEGKYRYEREGPSARGSGYTGGTYHLRVSMDF